MAGKGGKGLLATAKDKQKKKPTSRAGLQVRTEAALTLRALAGVDRDGALIS